MTEFLDILDSYGQPTGNKASRLECHEKGYWHNAIHIWAYNEKNEILVQKRSMTKDNRPGMYHTSVGGHVDSGRSIFETAVKESKEELNIDIDESQLSYIGMIRINELTSDKKMINKEFMHIFLYKTTSNLEIQLNDGEVELIKRIPIEQFKIDCYNKDLFVPEGNIYRSLVLEALRTSMK